MQKLNINFIEEQGLLVVDCYNGEHWIEISDSVEEGISPAEFVKKINKAIAQAEDNLKVSKMKKENREKNEKSINLDSGSDNNI